MEHTAITARGLRKSFGDRVVLDGVGFTIPHGSVFALLGPNGAGKTTTVRILTTLTRLDGGSATVAGHDVVTDGAGVRASIGVTGQFSGIDALLTAREHLILVADLLHLGRKAGRRKADELLERFGLVEHRDRRAADFSGGMQRRLDLAMTLVGEPAVIFLDEPTVGLDPRSRRDVWAIARELVDDGKTLFLTTQYLEEADRLADTVAVLHGGRVVASGSPEDLKREAGATDLDDVFLSLTEA